MSNNDKGSLPKIRLIVGLGNPDKNLLKTRHNVGYWYLDKFIEKYNVTLSEDKKLNSLFSKVDNEGDQIFLVRPTFFINDSGKSVSSFLKYYKINPDSMLVMHDDIDLNVGEVKLKFGGGHGGHNGLRDITNKIGSANFLRLRIGIGHPGSKDEVTNWVLNKFTPNEIKHLDQSYSKFIDIFELITANNIKEAQKLLHTK